MASRHDRSYGIIPIRRTEQGFQAFLINQYSRIGNNTYWVFPKGHPEKGETPVQTATRELWEETGFVPVAVIKEKTFALTYHFTFDGQPIEKTVLFFIGCISPDQQPKLDADEVREAGWFPLDEVRTRLDYEDTRTLFDQARTFIEENADSL